MPSVPAEAWAPFREYLDPGGAVPLNFGAFLVAEGERLTLVDTGLGGRANGPGGKLPSELERAGVRPEQISTVVITHLHPDHVGWNTVDRDGRPEVLFANARHIVQRRDWEFFTRPEIKAAHPFIGLCAEPLASAGLLDLIEGERSLSAAVSTLFTPGHTPGHQSVLIASGGEKAVITGDATHTPAQVERPDWSLAVDVDPALSARTRADLWDRVEREGLTVCAGHYPYPSTGRIVRVDGRRRWRWL
jgi:glyoxylase-like metal-dependent hydrolase (beta-lactamase superfamily II)